jgi:D-methionine transport system permease protein
VETALLELDPGIIEAADAMGATPFQVVTKVMLPEALPGLIMSVTTMLINLIGYSAMAGAVGGGGIGDLAIRYGFHRFRIDIMLATIVLLIILVQSVQSSGNHISKHLLSKRRK